MPEPTTAVDGIRPGDVLLFEHSYMSSASRNDFTRNVTNCVDVYIDGGNEVVADAVVPRPTSANIIVNDVTNRFHYDNFRRVGDAQHRPVVGNFLTPLYFQPVASVPPSLTIGAYNYYEGYHYWLVEDVSELGGTVRARNGIEWDKYLPGQQSGGVDNDPSTWTGPTIVYGDESGETNPVAPSVEIIGYTYDKNVNDLQAAADANKQTTTDALVHKATKRYFKLDLTVMYTPGVSVTDANATIRTAVQNFLDGQYFGSTIQLSDLLNVVHNVTSVDNVRWSYEVDTTRNRVTECNSNGAPLTAPIVDTVVWGASTRAQQVKAYFPAGGTGGTVTFSYNGTADHLPLHRHRTDQWVRSDEPARPVADDHGRRVADGDRHRNPGRAPTPSHSAATEHASCSWSRARSRAARPCSTRTSTWRTTSFPRYRMRSTAGDTVAGLIIRPRSQATWGTR
jgi:hypothetical protein